MKHNGYNYRTLNPWEEKAFKQLCITLSCETMREAERLTTDPNALRQKLKEIGIPEHLLKSKP